MDLVIQLAPVIGGTLNLVAALIGAAAHRRASTASRPRWRFPRWTRER
jgi:hypothetical protein